MNCPICDTELRLTDTFCPICGFEIHILPQGASVAVDKYERNRRDNYRKLWGSLENNSLTIQKQENKYVETKETLDRLQIELTTANNQNKDLANKLSSALDKISNLKTQIEEKQISLTQVKNTISELEKQTSEDKAKISKLTEEKSKIDALYNQLSKDMQLAQYEISQLKSELQTITKEKEKIEKLLSKKQSGQTTNTIKSNSGGSKNTNVGEKKGEVEFSNGQSKSRQDILAGNNSYTAPKSILSNHNGTLFVINENNGEFTIYDSCGSLRKANGRSIRDKGEQLTNGDIFNIGSIQIKIILPEIDFNSINF